MGIGGEVKMVKFRDERGMLAYKHAYIYICSVLEMLRFFHFTILSRDEVDISFNIPSLFLLRNHSFLI